MEDSSDPGVSRKKIKKSRWGPVIENDLPINKLGGEPGKVIPNGTGNSSSENVPEVDVKVKPKITKISKLGKTEQANESIKSLHKEATPVKVPTPCESPSSSQTSEDGFLGFDNVVLTERQSQKQDVLFRLLDQLNALVEARSSCSTPAEENIIDDSAGGESNLDVKENTADEEMTVDVSHVSDSDSDQMEIDMGNDKDNSSKADSNEFSDRRDKDGDRTKDSDVDIMETDSVKSDEGKVSKKNLKDQGSKAAVIDNTTAKTSILESTLKGSNVKIEYCGGCEAEVDDAEDGICCDGTCERWFHLRCSGLTQTEYDELGRDENAKWACNKCSGKPAPVLKADAKPLLAVRKDLAKVSSASTPSPSKRRSTNKEGIVRSPKIDISNPAFLKPFDFGWKRELVYRSTNDNHNKRQGDVYYYTPKGKKLRSLREITDFLVGTDLSQDNFTFWKEPIGIEDPEKEIIRDAKLKVVNKDSPTSTTPSVPKKVTPKITKTLKTTPKLTATVTPLDSSSSLPAATSTSTTTTTATAAATPKASASVTPRVVLKGKTNISLGPKFKVTPSKNTMPGQAQKIVISKVFTD